MQDWSKLRFYIFDWDDNVLFMDTKILVEELVNGAWQERPVSTSEYSHIRHELGAAVRYRYPLRDGKPDYNRAYAAFNDFTDDESQFIADSVAALEQGHLAPSFNCFKEAIINGSLFMICTARAHRPASLRKMVERFIRDYLTSEERGRMYASIAGYYNYFKQTDVDDPQVLLEWYLSKCGYVPISSPEFSRTLPGNCAIDVAKSIAVDRFVSYATGLFHKYADKISKISIGFSDDDCGNVRAIAALFRKHLERECPNVAFHVYSTAGKKKENVPV